MKSTREQIESLADTYGAALKAKISGRLTEMEDDDTTHYLLYRVLGISEEEGKLIDEYQNKGRFLYKYAGAFLEEAATICFKDRFPGAAQKMRILNTLGSRPKTFEIDCLIGKRAYEIKWRDATTDGDHITKEHTRIKAIKDAGYVPIRIMFYYPNRSQAIRIQETLKSVYAGVGGEYHFGDGAWNYVSKTTNIDLKSILESIALKSKKTHIL